MPDPAVEELFRQPRFVKRSRTSRIKRIDPRCVYVNTLYGVLRVAGEVKHAHRQRKVEVFFRGQDRHFRSMRPRLFRGAPEVADSLIQTRLQLMHDCQKEILHIKNRPARFEGTLGAAVLQHYRIPTAWLDLTDNLYVAAYFAAGGQSNEYQINGKAEKLGFIYCLKVNSELELTDKRQEPDEDTDHCWCDLRKVTNPLSLRPHAQHGVFLSRPERLLLAGRIDFFDMICAIIALPVDSVRNALDLEKFRGLMFPDGEDHTCKWLERQEEQNSELGRFLEKLQSECR